jgi:hypothetical protein
VSVYTVVYFCVHSCMVGMGQDSTSIMGLCRGCVVCLLLYLPAGLAVALACSGSLWVVPHAFNTL